MPSQYSTKMAVHLPNGFEASCDRSSFVSERKAERGNAANGRERKAVALPHVIQQPLRALARILGRVACRQPTPQRARWSRSCASWFMLQTVHHASCWMLRRLSSQHRELENVVLPEAGVIKRLHRTGHEPAPTCRAGRDRPPGF